MLYNYYKSIKTAIEPVTGINAVEWFNNQYEGTIYQDKVVWIEFPERIAINQLTKDMQRAQLSVRLHVISRVIQKSDSTIPDTEIIDHEQLAQSVLNILRGLNLTTDDGATITTKLSWAGWQHFHKYQGWMVTWVEFLCNTISI